MTMTSITVKHTSKAAIGKSDMFYCDLLLLKLIIIAPRVRKTQNKNNHKIRQSQNGTTIG